MKNKIKSKKKSIDSKTESESLKVDLEQTGLGKHEELSKQMENDTNMLILDGKKSKKDAEKDEKKEPLKRKLSKKERKKLEKVIERKNKSSRREELLEKLASVQVNSNELKMYSSVKDIGQKEKRKIIDNLSDGETRIINSISGSNKRKKTDLNTQSVEESTDTDDMSTDSEIDEEKIQKALDNHIKNVENHQEKYKPNKIVDSEDEEYHRKENASQAVNKRNTKYVHVDRKEQIKVSRSKLPIISEELTIMEKIYNNDIIIISGETGSGKTTQVPQFLYEAGYAENGMIIGVTEPRRVAAISMSKRVNEEMNFEESESKVSYQIRYEGTTSPNTRIKFMTDGVLLKEVQNDFLLTKYSAIIIDEAHERSVFTDILIGLLSRIVPVRNKRENPLKLIIMSATLRVEDFTDNRRLFKEIPPCIKVDARQFPVSVHFNKHTYQDYLAEAYRKICKIHRRLPDGGILVFLTGQQEVNVLCNKLKKTFPKRDFTNHQLKSDDNNKKESNGEQKINLDDYSTMPLIDEENEVGQDETELNLDKEDIMSDDDDEEDEEPSEDNPLRSSVKTEGYKPLYVLPLYAMLSTERQSKVFEQIPEGHRLCVIATNIAETSLTIPHIKYVVDSGKIKVKFYDKITGVSTFKICWTSKASADQRAGRAGRTSPGHCYRLYSSAVYNDEFPKFMEAEIARKPVEDLILQMKDLGIDRIQNFPFPTPPDQNAVKAAESLLVQLGALEYDKARIKNKKDEQITKITSLGKIMASFPINPRYGKMLTLASQQEDNKLILSYIICMISGLSVPELFLDGDTTINANPTTTSNGTEDQNKEPEKISVKYSQLRQQIIGGLTGSHSALLGDLMLLLVALGAVEYQQFNSQKSNDQEILKFCEQYGIRYKAIIEARKLRKQLVNTVNLIFPQIDLTIDPQMKPPNEEHAKLLRQLVLSGMVDRIAKRHDEILIKQDGKEIKNAYQSLLLAEPIFIHPSSVLFKELPAFVCYVDMVETSKMYMKSVCAIENEWLPIYLPSQCAFEKPIINETETDYESLKPRYCEKLGKVMCHRESTFGSFMWKIRPVEVEFPESLDLYKWFARFLLEGEIVPSLKKYTTVLLGSPSTMLKSWAKLQPRTEMLLNALIMNQCNSKNKLEDIWSNKKDYLLNEYLMWIPEALHFELRLKWPPIC
ncbi:unnamed protein product [Brachionus calyciflorus]|uniref:RNA helicase n=1 Tax=Brachionus calyciflorus TaxID=104777 RepID=A0A813ZAG0_9BILA|nr:unnamed protein product [Brachionus calyciflorus]